MSKCKLTGKLLSIQLGRDETHIVLMNKGTDVLHTARVETPAGAVEDGVIQDVGAVRDMLKAALKDPGFRHVRQAVFTLTTSQIITEMVTVPDLPEAKLEKLLQANVDMYFPVDMREYRMTWQIVGHKMTGDLKEIDVRLWAVPRQMLPGYYAVGNGCGLSVAAIDYCGHSLATAVGASFAQAGKKKKGQKQDQETASSGAEELGGGTDLHVTLEKDLLGMTFVRNRQVVYQRIIRCGADPAYQFGELAMMLEYFSSMESGRDSRIYGIASGSLANDSDLVRELSDVLGIGMTVLERGYDPGYVLCAGAARTTLDFGDPSQNKPAKVRKDLQQQLWQYGLILVGGLALIAVIMLTLSSRIVWSSSLGSLQTTQQTLSIQAAKTNGFADNYNRYAAKYDAYSEDWETIFTSLRTYNDNLVLVLQELENILPENSSVEELGIGTDKINVKFACSSKEEAAYLIMALRELKYAQLEVITDLVGKGLGPATSYGSGDEEPPTEGSGGNAAVTDLLAKDLSEQELLDASSSLSQSQVQLLNKKYGTTAPTVNPSLAALKSASSYDEKPFSNVKGSEREDVLAMRAMLTGNPFAAERFADMLINEDFDRGGKAILLGHIMLDLIQLQSSGKFDPNGNMIDNMHALVDVLTKDQTTLGKTEELLKTDPNMEKWYVYYLEVETGIQPSRKLVYLDDNKLVADLMDGSFNSGDGSLDKKLNGMVSDSTRDLLQSMNSDKKMGGKLTDYLNSNTAGNSVVDSLISQYLTTGTSGNKPIDEKLDSYIGSGAADQQFADLISKQQQTGTSGNSQFDKMVERYENKGSTGNGKLDALVGNYIKEETPTEPPVTEPPVTEPPVTEPPVTEPPVTEPKPTDPTEPPVTEPPATEPPATEPPATEPEKVWGDYTKDDLRNMAIQYMITGSTGNPMADLLLNNYKKTGTTGVPALDAQLKPYDDFITGKQDINSVIGKYMTTGTTGNKELDGMIEKYLTTGTTGNKDMDKVMDDYIASGAMDPLMNKMLDDYLTNGTTGSPLFDKMIDNYLTKGTTGNKTVDSAIDKYIDKGSVNSKLVFMLKNYVKTGSTGSKVVDSMVKNYFLTGSTGNKKVDKLIKDTISGNRPTPPPVDIPGLGDKPLSEVVGNLTVDQIGQIVENYLTTGSSGNEILDDMLADYFTGGSSGYITMDELIEKFIENGGASDELADLLLKYQNDNTSGNSALDKIIKNYLDKGTTGNPVLDSIFDAFLGTEKPEEPTTPTTPTDPNKPGNNNDWGNYTEEDLKQMALMYYLTGSTGNPFFDQLLNQYKKTGTTGIPELDKKLEPYKDFIMGSGGGSGGSGGGGYGGPAQEVKITFNAILTYKEALKNAELVRKGLNYGDKVDKLEVTD